ncbi:DUF1735 domain-containing protein [Sphingobacterium sp. UT-1RO-CII-1]|uniref:BT_3987 domain-containing protein n=1 Tax=Sphingobacterium sp. UT-1RO-CII-1 TaxID=2995225 RepID=UPI00227CA78B|nr:DUF1735 domain-containing protein [Sphingobacterium sp. UT-1RO-CII-1]MCY4780193.1 DUF1735 domain-containing protein [Sphingobacterium sp. UT-1RO-CII-1]
MLLFFTSCNNDKVFENEQYKNVFALISTGIDNVSEKFHDLGEESIGYVTASMGGTRNITRDVTVNLVEDSYLVESYNITNFDNDVSKYARRMSSNNYSLESYTFTIPAGSIGASVPIKIRPDGLSPDSVYFIPLRIQTHDLYEANQLKSYVLYSARMKNFYAKADGNTRYNMRAKHRTEGSSTELEMPGTKIMHPLTKNSVRVMVSNENFVSEVDRFEKLAIILEVDENNNVIIKPYKNVDIQQVEGDERFPNVFKLEDDGFKKYKTFLLRYNYTVSGKTTEIKEELRLEYKEGEDD